MKWRKKRFNKILDIFSGVYITSYKNIRGNGKFRAISYSGTCFKRWYYSSLVSDTILSPANLVQELSRQDKMNYVIAPTVKPIKSAKSIKGFEFRWCSYKTDDHPILSDLRIVTEKFIPDMNLKSNGFLSLDETFLISEELSQYDPFYTEFLVELAFGLKLIKPIKAIHTQKAFADIDAIDKFFLRNNEDILKNIINCTISLCAAKLSEVLDGASHIFDNGFILSLLKAPCGTDEIFRRVYASLGIDILVLMKKYEESNNDLYSLTEEEGLIISSTFFLGVMLDHWFLTPFGAYLRVIQPMYFFQFSIKNEISILLDDITSKNDLGLALFAPCTYYNITLLGEKLFLNGKKAKNQQPMPHDIDIDELLPAIFADYFERELEDVVEEDPDLFPYVLELKVRMENDKLYWRTYEVAGDTTLHDLHCLIAYSFNFSPSAKYSFFKDKQRSVFLQYDAPGTASKTKKANTIALTDFFTKDGQTAYYISYDVGEVDMEIQFIKMSDRRRGVYYPRIVRRSKKIREEEDSSLM